MKIDLHCHTLKAKKGDGETRNIDAKQFRTIMNDNNVKIAAITNHNVFDACQYDEFVQECGNNPQIWPGIELDVIGYSSDKNNKRKTGHVIIISNPKYVDEFNKEIERITKGFTPDDFAISISDLLELFSKLTDAIILPHYFKPKALDQDAIEEIKKGIQDKYRFFYEPSNYRSLGILTNHDCPSLVGSDVKDWNDYSSYMISNIKLDVDSFEQFLLLAKKDNNVVNTLLNKKTGIEIDISHKSSSKNKVNDTKKEFVRFYDDINIIFGTKGTGKSDVASRVYDYYKSKNIDVSYYTPNNNEDEINSKLKVTAEERKLDLIGEDNCESEFIEIRGWKEASIVQLKDFIDYQNSKDINTNKNKMKILDSKIYQNLNKDKIDEENSTVNKIKEVENTLNSIELLKYINEQEKEVLQNIIIELRKATIKEREKQWIDYESKKSSNKSIEILKVSIERNTETKTKPSKTGLFEFCDKRYSLIMAISKIINGFKYSFTTLPTFVGELEENKSLYLLTKYRMLSSNSKTVEFSNKITFLKEAKKSIESVYNHCLELNVSEYVGKMNELLTEYNFTSLDDFLGVIKVFSLNNGDKASEYKPSTGEATMIILQEKLNLNRNVFILDEPEKSLGNTYVNEVIVPKLIDLAKMRKTVIVVTHNANIAVRTFPYTSILKVYNNGIYKTYVGNPFVDKLISTSNPCDTLNWKEESLRVLEGGESAFEERGEIYGKKDN
ncbi:hypothetical protein HCG64_04685 [Coprobacillus sp. K06]|mgnify:CR=1 FL=1|uniref:hypothetical protein n=1 Tax=Coprobacillus sp. K06 TaxID=2718930 RepID=UPI001C8B7DA0|nr:hypothetical protein [Coprobacillus sp. K06]MBX9164372.1 hypothetical protein [Coprobacillus sp. K06]